MSDITIPLDAPLLRFIEIPPFKGVFPALLPEMLIKSENYH